jgi:glycosyltransferase involved in cell wall biosynthesis
MQHSTRSQSASGLDTVGMAYPVIEPLLRRSDDPLWSVMIPNYNAPDEFLVQTLESVLVQDLGSGQMQIEVVDNCSTQGNPEQVVNQIGKGRVGFYRQPRNLGMVGNFNTCIQRSRGQLVHLLHSDDYLAPEFYSHLGKLAQAYPEAGLLTCRVFEVDQQGQLQRLSDRLEAIEQPNWEAAKHYFYDNPFRTPAVVVRRKLYEQVGGWCPLLEHTCDWEMWVRLLNHSAAVALNQPLAFYRRSSDNTSTRTERTGQNLRDWIQMRDLFAAQYSHFNQAYFDQLLSAAAYWQAAKFLADHDRESAQQSAAIWWELQSPPKKIKQVLSTVFQIDRTKLSVLKHLRAADKPLSRSVGALGRVINS